MLNHSSKRNNKHNKVKLLLLNNKPLHNLLLMMSKLYFQNALVFYVPQKSCRCYGGMQATVFSSTWARDFLTAERQTYLQVKSPPVPDSQNFPWSFPFIII